MSWSRSDGRGAGELRPLVITAGFAPGAAGSVLIATGNTRVICAATWEASVPKWMQAEGKAGGWLTAEYSMLPYSTVERKARDISKGKLDGRTVEIQRLIGRALRAVIDLQKMPGRSLWIDCDVLQADGGTRTASITGAYVAAQLAIRRAMAAGELAENPFAEPVAAVSVGVVGGEPVLDLCYVEDRDAEVDANLVMTASGRWVEVQASGEEATFTGEQLEAMLALGRKGLSELFAAQARVLAQAE